MAFTVARKGGSKDVDFTSYARLLRRRKIDLSHISRTPEPGTPHRWLYVWDARAEAEKFAEQLRKETRDAAWYVHEVTGPVAFGPLGMIEIELGVSGENLIFGLCPYSEWILERLYPGSCPADDVAIRVKSNEAMQHFLSNMPELAERVFWILTGLGREVLREMGYCVLDPVTGREFVFIPSSHASGSDAGGVPGSAAGVAVAVLFGSSESQALR